MRNKKTLIIIGLIFTVAIIALVPSITNSKYIPNYLTTKPRTTYDQEVANALLQELKDKYNVNFTMTGVAYSGYLDENDSKIDRVSAVYAYSDEYPDVYIGNYIESGLYWHFDDPHSDAYLEEVNAYNFKQEIYRIAEQLNIDTSLIGVDVGNFQDDADSIYIGILVNKKLTLDNIKELLQTVLRESHKNKLTTDVYITDKGDRRQFERFILDFVDINNNYIEMHFKNFQEYKLIITSQGIEETKVQIHPYIKED